MKKKAKMMCLFQDFMILSSFAFCVLCETRCRDAALCMHSSVKSNRKIPLWHMSQGIVYLLTKVCFLFRPLKNVELHDLGV